ncbi:MAG TPA: DNA-directed RNA polymerase subunit beta, partial [Leptospiraceae bacterium]|nr:DNA-directed RNA polymerase subunit beta [Leptospiraceae bacterium]
MAQNKYVRLGTITDYDQIPDLIDIQFKSYDWFLQKDAGEAKRKSQGLDAVFQETFPIESPNEDMVLEYVSYSLGDPRWDEEECKNRGTTYALPLKAIIRLINKLTGEVREQSVYMGDLPVMT